MSLCPNIDGSLSLRGTVTRFGFETVSLSYEWRQAAATANPACAHGEDADRREAAYIVSPPQRLPATPRVTPWVGDIDARYGRDRRAVASADHDDQPEHPRDLWCADGGDAARLARSDDRRDRAADYRRRVR